jgi:SAM-dependent methyltransferase
LIYNWPSFLDLLPPAGRGTLDLGCGEGRAGIALRDLGHRVTGVDAAPSLAKLATQSGAYEKVIVADAAALPFPDRSFDLVLAFMSLQDIAGQVTRQASVPSHSRRCGSLKSPTTTCRRRGTPDPTAAPRDQEREAWDRLERASSAETDARGRSGTTP